MIEVIGKGGIVARVVCDSINESGNRLTSILVDYPRIVHAEQLKHRMFSTSAASSRAIPFAKMAEQLTGKPISFGKNQAGMQAGEDYDALVPDSEHHYGAFKHSKDDAWEAAKDFAVYWSQAFSEAGYHKQVYNRLTEPFQMMRVLITATEWDNFWYLRKDSAADPTLHETARVMKEVYDSSKPQLLQAGEYHLPFVVTTRNAMGLQEFWEDNYDGRILSTQEAIIVSCARCAAQSFRNTDYGLEKSKQVYDRLVNGDKIHAGALEHVATPMKQPKYLTECSGSCYGVDVANDWEEGVSHMDRNGQLWSGNLRGFIQHRKTVKGECYNG